MASSLWDTSLSVYQGNWGVFMAWCGELGISPLPASVPMTFSCIYSLSAILLPTLLLLIGQP